jgi:hypothetical protein
MSKSDNDLVRPLDITIEYLERYASWCAILECPPGCECGERKIVHGFASRGDAEAAAAAVQAGWPSSPEADLLRADLAAWGGR